MMRELSAIGALNSAVPEDRQGVQKQQKAALTENDRARLQSAAQEFEALFLGLMLKEMRATVEESDLGGHGLGQSTYTEMFDQEVARSLSARGALGVADLLLRNLSNRVPAMDGEAGSAISGADKKGTSTVPESPREAK
jgi:flagellar protein FlgJ